MRIFIMMCIGAALLAGCATPAERSARMQAEMDRMIQVYGPACSKLGYTTNSDPWRNCVLQLSAKDELDRYAPYPHYYAGFGRPYWGGAYWGPYWH